MILRIWAMDSLIRAGFHAGMTNHAQDDSTILVLGATGKTGGRVMQRLQARGVPTRAGSRTARPPFDWSDPDTWAPALTGVSAVYITYFPDLAVPGAPEAVGELARLAGEHGVQRLVLLSGRGEEEAQRSEEVVKAAGIDWTILRSSWFDQNFSEGFLVDAVVGGVVALPVDAVREPFVHADDLADIAVAALTEDGHAGQLYEVTGPRLLSYAEAVAEIAAATGRDVRFETISMDEFEGGLAQAGLSDDEAWLVKYLFSEVMDGRNESLADGVQRALGREPRDFADYTREAAASGVWDA
jgi:uncharacterized protein YbjT (DUF2867 family)